MSTVRIQLRRGTAAEWTAANPVLAPGEAGVETDTNQIKIGNGTDTWDELVVVNETPAGFQNALANYIETADLGQPNGPAQLNSSGKIESGDFEDNIIINGTLDVSGATTTEDLTVNGDLVVNGTTTTVSTANFTTEDAMIYLGEGNTANSVDLGIISSFDNGTYQHAGLVRDASDGIWKLFSGVVTEPTTTVDFTTHNRDTLEIGALLATGATIGNVSNTEIQYLDGVTSAIQTQLNSKAPSNDPVFTGTVAGITKSMVGLGNVDNIADADKPISQDTQNALDLKAPLASPEFTGTVVLPANTITATMLASGSVTATKIQDGSVTSEKIANGTIVDADINSSAAIAQSKILGLSSDLALKADLESPTFTGTVVLPVGTSVGNVDSTELQYLNGVTSAIQTQIDAKASSSDLSTHASDTTSIHGIADTAALALTADVNTALDLKANLAGPTFTGTVSGITKSMVGLGNVDNTSDASKPVSSATQTALDLKASLTGATFTGDVTVETNFTVDGNLTVSGTTTTVNTTNFTTSDPLIYLGEGNTANLVDIGFVGSYNDGTYAHQGLAKDSSDGKWKLFKGVTDEPTTTINFTQGSLDALKVGAFEATTVTPSSGVVFSDGTQTKEGVPSITTIGTQISTSTNLSSIGLTARDQMIPVAGTVNITIPANATTAYPVGTSIDFYQASGSAAAFVADSGVTFINTPGLKFRATGSVATAMKVATNTWLIFGDLSA